MTYDPNNPGGYGGQGGFGQNGGFGQQGGYGAAGNPGGYGGHDQNAGYGNYPNSGYDSFPANPNLTIGGTLSFAWNAFTRNIGGWLLLTLISLGVALLANLPGMNAQMDAFNAAQSGDPTAFNASVNVGADALASVISVVVGLVIGALAIQAALRIVDGETLPIGEFFKFKNFGSYTVIYLITVIAAIIGGVIIIIGWIALLVAFVLFYFCYYAAVDGVQGVKDPFVRSLDIVKNNAGLCIGLGATFIGLYIVGFLTCGLGLFIVTPLNYLAAAYVYRHAPTSPTGTAGTTPEPQYPQQY